MRVVGWVGPRIRGVDTRACWLMDVVQSAGARRGRGKGANLHQLPVTSCYRLDTECERWSTSAPTRKLLADLPQVHKQRAWRDSHDEAGDEQQTWTQRMDGWAMADEQRTMDRWRTV